MTERLTTISSPLICAALLVLAASAAAAQPTTPAPPAAPAPSAVTSPAVARRRIAVADIDRIAVVRDPQRSPDGAWVAYAVSTVDVSKDSTDSDVWMVKWDGSARVRLTSSPESESSPRWSPDGQSLAFLRQDDKKTSQVWTLNRLGGEAQKLTEVAGGVSDYAWSRDGRRLVLVTRDADPDAAEADKPGKVPKPLEIETFKFKRDGVGYVDGRLRTHLQVFDVATRTAMALTSGPYDDSSPAWSPDGRYVAFLSARAETREKTTAREVYVIEPKAGATPRQISAHVGRHSAPLAWRPDSQALLYMEGTDPRYDAYEQYQMVVVPVVGGTPRPLAPTLDRPVSAATWSHDGNRVVFVVADDREQYVASVAATAGAITRITSGPQVVHALDDISADGGAAVLVSRAARPDEVHALDGGTLRPLTDHNAWMAKDLQLGSVKAIDYTTPDGVRIGALLTLPPGTDGATRLPFVLDIHGGPNGQDTHAFNFDREWIAANGYAVLQVNYRGSHGRGQAFQSAIFGDWGNKEVIDLLAGVDWAIKAGIADPDRLGIGGWSYGGILTNYAIATDQRFKAAVSGAASSLQFTMYGTDQYIVQYETEMGQPWKTMDRWMKVSYPFFKVEQIRTPTMFMAGEKDVNVPAIGSEQMYQAFKSTGIPTKLVIYPGQFHGITRPSYRRHRLEQWVRWFDTYLKPAGDAARPAAPTAGGAR